MYWELRCCGGKSHILTIQHLISKIAENSLVKLGIWLPYNSSLSHSMQPRQTYSPGFTNGPTDKKSRQAINPSAAMLRSGLKVCLKLEIGSILWTHLLFRTIWTSPSCIHGVFVYYSWNHDNPPKNQNPRCLLQELIMTWLCDHGHGHDGNRISTLASRG